MKWLKYVHTLLVFQMPCHLPIVWIEKKWCKISINILKTPTGNMQNSEEKIQLIWFRILMLVRLQISKVKIADSYYMQPFTSSLDKKNLRICCDLFKTMGEYYSILGRCWNWKFTIIYPFCTHIIYIHFKMHFI